MQERASPAIYLFGRKAASPGTAKIASKARSYKDAGNYWFCWLA